jgi:RNA polymerase sigma-70 factor (ECF subfamily)
MSPVPSLYGSEPDGELIAAIAAGNQQAMQVLYRDYRPRLVKFVSGFARCPANTDEIVNDTFMAIWRGSKNFRYASKVSTWIFGIAYRCSMRSVRKARRGERMVGLEHWTDPTTDPGHETEVSDWIARGVCLLPCSQRHLIQLVYQSGHSIEEIARLTDSPIGTVKSRMFHARRQLRLSLVSLSGDTPRCTA